MKAIRGFTILESLIVLAVLAALTVILLALLKSEPGDEPAPAPSSTPAPRTSEGS